MPDPREQNASLVGDMSNNKLLDPRGRYLRWIALFFMCFLLFGKPYLNLVFP
jgi:hypothetical protein